VVVNFEINDPPGLGINGDFIPLGTVTQAEFPDLGTINPGEFVDVFIEWTPTYDVSDEELEDGLVNLHTCLRVKLDAVANETVLGNQDGDREQENIFYFEVPEEAGTSAYNTVFRLYNDDPFETEFFFLQYESDLPEGWELDINGGDLVVKLAPHEMVEVPVQVTAHMTDVVPFPAGTVFGVDISASRLNLLQSELDPKDQHPEFETLGGVRVETSVQNPVTLPCDVRIADNGMIYVRCKMEGLGPNDEPTRLPGVLVAGAYRIGGKLRFLPEGTRLARMDKEANISLDIPASSLPEGAQGLVVLFAGTDQLTSASSGYLPILDNRVYLPLQLKNYP
jgi:hypothetical protein